MVGNVVVFDVFGRMDFFGINDCVGAILVKTKHQHIFMLFNVALHVQWQICGGFFLFTKN